MHWRTQAAGACAGTEGRRPLLGGLGAIADRGRVVLRGLGVVADGDRADPGRIGQAADCGGGVGVGLRARADRRRQTAVGLRVAQVHTGEGLAQLVLEHVGDATDRHCGLVAGLGLALDAVDALP